MKISHIKFYKMLLCLILYVLLVDIYNYFLIIYVGILR